jgi:probable rRNA maturation factor
MMLARIGVELDLVEASPLWKALPEAPQLAGAAVEAAFAAAGLRAAAGAELAIVLSDDAGVRELNRTWRGKDAPTNVLTFPAVEPDGIATAPVLGDVVLAFETVEREATAEGKRPADHFVHLVVHGVLHVYGFDHGTDAEAEAMEDIERRALSGLGIADPYAEPAHQGGSAAANGSHD